MPAKYHIHIEPATAQMMKSSFCFFLDFTLGAHCQNIVQLFVIFVFLGQFDEGNLKGGRQLDDFTRIRSFFEQRATSLETSGELIGRQAFPLSMFFEIF